MYVCECVLVVFILLFVKIHANIVDSETYFDTLVRFILIVWDLWILWNPEFPDL